jgi:hypothetical protein
MARQVATQLLDPHSSLRADTLFSHVEAHIGLLLLTEDGTATSVSTWARPPSPTERADEAGNPAGTIAKLLIVLLLIGVCVRKARSAAQGHRYVSVLKGAPVEEHEQPGMEGDEASPYIFDDRGSFASNSDAVIVSHETMISHETIDLIEKAMLDKVEPAKKVTALETAQAALEPHLIDLELSDGPNPAAALDSAPRVSVRTSFSPLSAACTASAPEYKPQLESASSSLRVESSRGADSPTNLSCVQPSPPAAVAAPVLVREGRATNGTASSPPPPSSQSSDESLSTVPNDELPKGPVHKIPAISMDEDGFESAEAQRSISQRPSAAAELADAEVDIDLWEPVTTRVPAGTAEVRPML